MDSFDHDEPVPFLDRGRVAIRTNGYGTHSYRL